MTVKELIQHLTTFDEDHVVGINVDAECGCLKVICPVDEVKFIDGNCTLLGTTD